MTSTNTKRASQTQKPKATGRRLPAGEGRDASLRDLESWRDAGFGDAAWRALMARAELPGAPLWLRRKDLGLDSELEHRILCLLFAKAVLAPRKGEEAGDTLGVKDLASCLRLPGLTGLCQLYQVLARYGSLPMRWLRLSLYEERCTPTEFREVEVQLPMPTLRTLMDVAEPKPTPDVPPLEGLYLPRGVQAKVRQLLAAPPDPAKAFWLALVGPEGSGRWTLATRIAHELGKTLVSPSDLMAGCPSPREVLLLAKGQDQDWELNPFQLARSQSWVFLRVESEQDPVLTLADMRLDLGEKDPEALHAFWIREAVRKGIQAPVEQVGALAERFPLPIAGFKCALDLAGRKIRFSEGTPESHAAALEAALATVSTPRAGRSPRRNVPGLPGQVEVALEKTRPSLGFGSLVLPGELEETLQRRIRSLKGRDTLLKDWGLDGRLLPKARGIFLFHGPSGTGKSMAAEVMATELGVELWRVDASTLQSPFVGETEQRIASLFKATRGTDAVILLDEVDNFLHDRSQDRSTSKTHNQGMVNAFLRELDTFEGTLVFTTNLGSELDPAVERRIQHRLAFPAPGPAERLRIWRNLWSDAIPQDGSVDLEALALRFDLSGGLIRNAFLEACQRAAEAGAMTQEILLRTCREEDANRLAKDQGRRIRGFAVA